MDKILLSVCQGLYNLLGQIYLYKRNRKCMSRHDKFSSIWLFPISRFEIFVLCVQYCSGNIAVVVSCHQLWIHLFLMITCKSKSKGFHLTVSNCPHCCSSNVKSLFLRKISNRKFTYIRHFFGVPFIRFSS